MIQYKTSSHGMSVTGIDESGESTANLTRRIEDIPTISRPYLGAVSVRTDKEIDLSIFFRVTLEPLRTLIFI